MIARLGRELGGVLDMARIGLPRLADHFVVGMHGGHAIDDQRYGRDLGVAAGILAKDVQQSTDVVDVHARFDNRAQTLVQRVEQGPGLGLRALGVDLHHHIDEHAAHGQITGREGNTDRCLAPTRQQQNGDGEQQENAASDPGHALELEVDHVVHGDLGQGHHHETHGICFVGQGRHDAIVIGGFVQMLDALRVDLSGLVGQFDEPARRFGQRKLRFRLQPRIGGEGHVAFRMHQREGADVAVRWAAAALERREARELSKLATVGHEGLDELQRQTLVDEVLHQRVHHAALRGQFLDLELSERALRLAVANIAKQRQRQRHDHDQRKTADDASARAKRRLGGAVLGRSRRVHPACPLAFLASGPRPVRFIGQYPSSCRTDDRFRQLR